MMLNWYTYFRNRLDKADSIISSFDFCQAVTEIIPVVFSGSQQCAFFFLVKLKHGKQKVKWLKIKYIWLLGIPFISQKCAFMTPLSFTRIHKGHIALHWCNPAVRKATLQTVTGNNALGLVKIPTSTQNCCNKDLQQIQQLFRNKEVTTSCWETCNQVWQQHTRTHQKNLP